MAEYLYNLLSLNCLLNIPIERAQGRLLGREILLAPAGHKASRFHHKRYHNNGNHSQVNIRINHQNQRPYDTERSGKQLNQRTAEHVSDSIHIICKTAHQIAVIISIIKAKRKLLHLCEQLLPDPLQRILRYRQHNPGLRIIGCHAEQINPSHHD